MNKIKFYHTKRDSLGNSPKIQVFLFTQELFNKFILFLPFFIGCAKCERSRMWGKKYFTRNFSIQTFSSFKKTSLLRCVSWKTNIFTFVKKHYTIRAHPILSVLQIVQKIKLFFNVQ